MLGHNIPVKMPTQEEYHTTYSCAENPDLDDCHKKQEWYVNRIRPMPTLADSQASFEATQSMMQDRTMTIEVQKRLGKTLAMNLVQKRAQSGLGLMGLMFNSESLK